MTWLLNPLYLGRNNNKKKISQYYLFVCAHNKIIKCFFFSALIELKKQIKNP